MPHLFIHPPSLAIDRETLNFIIVKAREFDAKLEPAEPDPAASPSGYENDHSFDELRTAIGDLNDDQVVDLIALTWVGRGDYGAEGWRDAQSFARQRHRRHSADYLVGMPALGDYVEEGLATIGYDTTELGSDRH